ncbi:MAG: glycosyltransferase family 2 protein [Chloroflexota bacterium]|nr:glycosyltransferase family 2 protein [Chloroflexota bacterium]
MCHSHRRTNGGGPWIRAQPVSNWGTELRDASEGARPWASISVFFPCHNEEENVAQVIGDAVEHLPTVADDFEIIIVDDGSTDDTAARAGAIAERDSRVRVVSHPTNFGYGRALRTGFESAEGDLIFCADGDGQFSLADLPAVVHALDDHGFVLGYRINRADPFYRRLNAWLWGLSVRVLLGFRVRDLDCGFKLYRREAVPVEDFISGRGAAISAELIARALRGGHSFTQVGVTHYPRRAGVQSGNSPKVILNSFLDIVQLWRGLRSS